MEDQVYIPREKPLKNAVQLFWEINRKNTGLSKEVIVPKGIVEIVFNFSSEVAFNSQLYNETFKIPKCFIQGYHTCPITLDLPDSQSLFGVVLQATATRSLFQVPAGEFARQCIDLTLVDPAFNTLWHQLAEKETFQERTIYFSDWLFKRLSSLTDFELAINELLCMQVNKTLDVPTLSDWLCYSPRHLSRIFYGLTGMNTENTLLYLKYRKALDLIHYSNLSLTRIAYACEFSDQSHFIKTFKRFTSITPKAYQSKKSNVAGHLFEYVR
ncbi:MAG: AraC family transcriptional regulator [Chitinophagaceae bacterium]|nr:MAG: AraC family transcriptional regulator [Chitinophagaceae bacterium]